MGPYNQPQHLWYYTMPAPYMHQQPHQHGPHSAPPHQPGPLPMSPRPAAPPLPGTPTMAYDGMEVTLDALKKHSPQPPTVPTPPASPILTNRRTTSIRMETEEAKRSREDALRKEQEKKDAKERAKKVTEEKKKRDEEEEAERKRKAKEDRIRKEEEERERIWQDEEEKENERLRREEEERLEAQRKDEEEKARIIREEEEQKQKDTLEAEEAQLEADEADDIVETTSPVSEALWVVTSSMPPPSELPRRRPDPLDLASAKRDVSAPPPSALVTARVIENLSEVEYPEGIKSPQVELNANSKGGQFRFADLLL